MQLVTLMAWCAAIHYIVAAAEITRGLRMRAPGFILALLVCPVCCGWWIGLLSSPYVAAPSVGGGTWWERALWGGIFGMFLTPIGNAIRRQSFVLATGAPGAASIEAMQRELMSALAADADDVTPAPSFTSGAASAVRE